MTWRKPVDGLKVKNPAVATWQGFFAVADIGDKQDQLEQASAGLCVKNAGPSRTGIGHWH